MADSNIDLFHGRKNNFNDNQKPKRKYHETVEMHVPDEDGEPEEIERPDSKQKEEIKPAEPVKSSASLAQPSKKSFWKKLKNIFKKSQKT